MVVSAGRNNQYGHPQADALRLYADQGSRVYRTDQHGTIVFEVDNSGRYTVDVERGEGAQPPPPRLTARSPVPQQTACIDLNTATLDDLQEIIHIGPVRARSILQLRAVTPFRSVQSITRVSGIAAGRLRDILAEGRACVR